MRKILFIILILIFAALAFVAGDRYGKDQGNGATLQTERKILYYTDPMNPGFRSEKPQDEELKGGPREKACIGLNGLARQRPPKKMTSSVRPDCSFVSPCAVGRSGTKALLSGRKTWQSTDLAIRRRGCCRWAGGAGLDKAAGSLSSAGTIGVDAGPADGDNAAPPGGISTDCCGHGR